MEIPCGSAMRRPSAKSMKIVRMYCHDIRNCPICQTIAAKGLARQLDEGAFVMSVLLSEVKARKMIRRLGKGNYKRVPQSDGTVILFHQSLSELGDVFEGEVNDLKIMIAGIPIGKRISGHLGGLAEEASRPWLANDLDGKEPPMKIKTFQFHIADIRDDESDALCDEAYQAAWDETIRHLPLTCKSEVQQATNSVMYQVRKRIEERGLTFDLIFPVIDRCDLASVSTWKKDIDAETRQRLPVEEKKVIRRSVPSLEWVLGARTRVAARAA